MAFKLTKVVPNDNLIISINIIDNIHCHIKH